MSSSDIQDCVDARVNSCKDLYMDDHMIHKLKVDLMEDTRAHSVDVQTDLELNALTAFVHLGLDTYESTVELSQRVVRLKWKTPGTFDEGTAVSDLPEDVRKAHAEAHVQKAQERSDDMAKAQEDKAAEDQANADKAAKNERKVAKGEKAPPAPSGFSQ